MLLCHYLGCSALDFVSRPDCGPEGASQHWSQRKGRCSCTRGGGVSISSQSRLRILCNKSCRVLWRMPVKRCLIILQINIIYFYIDFYVVVLLALALKSRRRQKGLFWMLPYCGPFFGNATKKCRVDLVWPMTKVKETRQCFFEGGYEIFGNATKKCRVELVWPMTKVKETRQCFFKGGYEFFATRQRNVALT